MIMLRRWLHSRLGTGLCLLQKLLKDDNNSIYADPKVIQQINFTGNLDQERETTNFFIIEEAKETIPDFSQGTVTVMSFYFALI